MASPNGACRGLLHLSCIRADSNPSSSAHRPANRGPFGASHDPPQSPLAHRPPIGEDVSGEVGGVSGRWERFLDGLYRLRGRLAVVVMVFLALLFPLASTGEATTVRKSAAQENATQRRHVSTPTPFQTLAFYLHPDASYGPNESIEIIAGVGYKPDCRDAFGMPKGTNDGFAVQFADAYIVPSGSIQGGGKIDGTPKPLIAFSFLVLGEQIGITAPTGKIGPGSYAVIFDECQDGRFDPAEDAIWDPGFTVGGDPTGLPTSLDLRALKAAADTAAKDTAPLVQYCAGKVAHEVQVPGVVVTATVVLSVGYPVLGIANKSTWAAPSICTTAGQLKRHYEAIRDDPPDPDYKQPTVVTSPVRTTSALDDLDSTTSRVADLSQGLLHAIERYQGAVAGADDRWAVQHLDEIERLAQEASQATQSFARAASHAAADLAAREPGIDTSLAKAAAVRNRILSTGYSTADRQELLNAGLAPAQLDALLTLLPSAPLPSNIASLDSALNNTTVPALAAVRTALDDLALTARRLVADGRNRLGAQLDPPRANAGGPYLRSGGSLVLDATKSLPSSGTHIVRYDWDLDGDGAFDDAQGPTPSVPTENIGHLIAVRVLDANGRSAVDTTSIPGDAGLVLSSSPPTRFLEAAVGAPTGFEVTPRPGAAVTWLVDNRSVATGPHFDFAPDAKGAGIRTIVAEVRSGAAVQQVNWTLLVLAADSDGDGWRANVDCDDQVPSLTDDCSIRYSVVPFVSGLSATAATWDDKGNYFVAAGSSLYRFDGDGGSYDSTHLVGSTGLRNPLGMTYDPTGHHLYVTDRSNGVYELESTTGRVIKTILPEGSCDCLGLAYDTTTGDLIVGTFGRGLLRIAQPQSVTPTVIPVDNAHNIDGVTVGPDGTIYAAHYESGIGIYRTDGTSSFIPAPGADGIAAELRAGQTVALWVNQTNGQLVRLDLTVDPPRPTPIALTNQYGDLVSVGPDGCMYATFPNNGHIDRITNADGTCNLAPTTTGPRVALTPPEQTLRVGELATIAAQVLGVPTPQGTPVTFAITGANPSSATVMADENGVATLSYPGTKVGSDQVHASALVSGKKLDAVPANVTWQRGVNRPPSAKDLFVTTTIDTPINTAAPTVDADSDPLSHKVLVTPNNGTLLVAGGTLTYTPAPGFQGLDQAVLETSDGQATSPTWTLTVQVGPSNLPPIAKAIDATTATEQPVTLAPIAADPENQSLVFDVAARALHGTVTFDASTGVFSYTSAAGFVGRDAFVWQAKDAAGNVARSIGTVTVTPAVQPPSPSPTGNPTSANPTGSNVLGGQVSRSPAAPRAAANPTGSDVLRSQGSSGDETLPTTGTELGVLLEWAVLLVGVGSLLLLKGRWRPTRQVQQPQRRRRG